MNMLVPNRHASAQRSSKDLKRKRRDARSLIQSYVTSSSDPEDHANMVPHVQLYLMGITTPWFDELLLESIDSFVELRKAFLAYFLLQKKYIKYPIESHHIKQREGELAELFMDRFKAKSLHVNGVSECLKRFREINQENTKGGEHTKVAKKGEVARKEKSPTIFKGGPPHGDPSKNRRPHDMPYDKYRYWYQLEIKEHSTSNWMNFMVVRSLSPYNGIIERPRIKKIQAVLSTAHRKFKFPVTKGVVTMHSSKVTPVVLNGHEIRIRTYHRNPNYRDKGHQDINPPRIPGSDNHHRQKPNKKWKDGTP
ncbi:hypothetical protein Tco_1156949 [Tanacetum coccineum]